MIGNEFQRQTLVRRENGEDAARFELDAALTVVHVAIKHLDQRVNGLWGRKELFRSLGCRCLVVDRYQSCLQESNQQERQKKERQKRQTICGHEHLDGENGSKEDDGIVCVEDFDEGLEAILVSGDQRSVVDFESATKQHGSKEMQPFKRRLSNR